jgi:hypothetical protein
MGEKAPVTLAYDFACNSGVWSLNASPWNISLGLDLTIKPVTLAYGFAYNSGVWMSKCL